MFRYLFWRRFTLLVGVDLRRWGVAFVINFDYPRGSALQLGPVYIRFEKS